MAGVSALGIVSGTLGIFSFILGQIPDAKQQSISVELAVGYARNPSTGEQLDSPDGKFRDIYVYDPVNNMVGSKRISGKYFNQGEIKTIDVGTGGRQPEFLQVTATNNAVCMSWMAATPPGNVASRTNMFSGDLFQYCDLPANPQEWYFGDLRAGDTDDGSPWFPKCGWLDGDGTNGHRFATVKARLPVYTGEDNNFSKNYLCRPPNLEFGTDRNPISKRDHAKDIKVKRSGTRGDNSLVTSSRPQHSARELCESPNSSGPDFVSLHEGLYCDMATRELMPMCSLGSILDGCVEVDTVLGNLTRIASDGNNVQKAFSRVVKFGDEN